jgi:hypothetical protein
MCTTALSPRFIEERFLSQGEARASHNTFMTMIVDHGVIGGVLYVGMVIWVILTLRVIAGRLRNRDGPFIAAAFPAVAAAMAAIVVGDLFAQYPKLEARIWFISILIVMLHFTESTRRTVEKADKIDALRSDPA